MTRRTGYLSRLAGWAFVAFVLLAFSPQHARASEPEVWEAEAAIVCDQAGNVYWERNADEELAPASITKIMTAMVALDSGLDLDQSVSVVAADLDPEAQRAGYLAGDVVSLRELMLVTLVYSGNDAAYNVACAVAGSEEAFCDLMNAKAAELGMSHTHFMNSHGLEEDGHYSCARDLMIMGRYALTHYPFIAAAVRLDGVEATVDGITYYLESTDDLMGSYEGLIGIKTGLVASGTAFLGASTRDGVALYTCVLGCATDEGRFVDTANIMDWAYSCYRTRAIGTDWTLRYAPSTTAFALRCPVRVAEGSTLRIWPEGGLSYHAVGSAPGLMLDEGAVAGALWWQQEGRFAGGYALVADMPVSSVPAVNIFEQDLFASAA